MDSQPVSFFIRLPPSLFGNAKPTKYKDRELCLILVTLNGWLRPWFLGNKVISVELLISLY